MPNSVPCPDAQRLQQALLGLLPDVEAEPIEQHLLTCSTCARTAGTLEAEDAFVQAMRAEVPRDSEEAEKMVAELQRRLRELRPSAPGSVTAPTGDTPEKAVRSPNEATQEVHDFLALPQEPDELGRLGPYRVLRLLGAGGMGVVFHAQELPLGRAVALKVIRPALAACAAVRQRFLREARAAAAVQHDHIIAIFRVGEERGVPFLAMPLLHGETLEDCLQREGRLPFPEVVRLGRQIAAGLAAAHARGLIHRDIKPGNIWLETCSDEPDVSDSLSRVKILDFGLARAIHDDLNVTRVGAVVGTPAYMAPEQARGQAVDGRCDLFSLGCVLYRASTGQAPFHGETTTALLLARERDTPAPPHALTPDVPPALSELIVRLLAKDPAQRPASARATIEALESIARAPAATPVARPATRRFRRRFAGLAAAALFVAVGGLLIAQLLIRIRDQEGSVRKVADHPDEKIDSVRQPPAAGPLPDKPKPFVLVRARGGEQQEYLTFLSAVNELQPGDAIEVHGNGPFPLGAIRLRNRPLQVRAAPGFRPQFVEPKSGLNGAGPWILVEGTSLLLEGCDFRCPPDRTAFRGGGEPWTIRTCRLFGPLNKDKLQALAPRLFEYSGPRLTVADSYITQAHGCSLHAGPETLLEVKNNVFFSLGGDFLYLAKPGGQVVRLQHNTFYGSNTHLLCLPFDKEEGVEPATVHATGNIFRLIQPPLIRPDPDKTLMKPISERLRWHGRQNLYSLVGDEFLGTPKVVGLASWEKFWGRREEGSRTGDAAFRWGEGGPHDGLVWSFRDVTAALRRQIGEEAGEVGPNWDLVGPGQGYVRALAAAGRAVPIRPAAEPGGPVTLMRQGKVVRGYPGLQQAIDASVTGDTLEIRTDDKVAGAVFGLPPEGKKVLTLCGAPGYSPTLDGLCLEAGNELTVENIHFYRWGPNRAPIPPRGKEGCVPRLANCSFDGINWDDRFTTTLQATGEVVNCLVRFGRWPPPFRAALAPGRKVVLRNTVIVGSPDVGTSPRSGEGQLELDHCIFWVPTSFAFWCTEGRIAITARHTLFELGNDLIAAWGAEVSAWQGSHNVYGVGRYSWISSASVRPVIGLDAWRKRWNSPEDGSVEADPIIYDPLQWQLRPQSPGYRAAGGKDLGADVGRVASPPGATPRSH